MYHTLRKKFQKKTLVLKGFSLGEVLLAAFVLTAGLLSVTALIASSMKTSFETRDAIIATGLAQEGIELVRNVRDNDLAVDGNGFTSFSNANHCRADYNDPSTSLNCSSNASDIHSGNPGRYYLQYSASGLYEHASTAASRFSRYIFIDYNSAQGSALVRSFVYWGNILPSIPNGNPNGNPVPCTVSNKCVFTEVTLTAWK